jgi:hypothetical protein
VHRLGRTDAQYKHTYNVSSRTLTVDEAYLLGAFNLAFSFCEYFWNEAKSLIEEASRTASVTADRIVELTLETKTQRGAALIQPEFHFDADDVIVSVSEITSVHDSDGERENLTISGDSRVVHVYVTLLRKAARNGDIVIHQHKTNRGDAKTPKCHLSRSQIEAIAKQLPCQPWPKGVHKQIAADMGTSNGQVSAAITIILNDESLLGLTGEKKLT